MIRLSPSNLMLYRNNIDAWYLRYIKGCVLEQTAPMAVGSVFDIMVKDWLRENVNCRCGYDAREELHRSVREDLRAQAVKDGSRVWVDYKECGLMDLVEDIDYILDMQGDVELVIPAVEVEAVLRDELAAGWRPWGWPAMVAVGDMVIHGKPDLIYMNRSGERVVADWKVSGFYSKSGISPKPGYSMCFRDRCGHKNVGRIRDIDEDWYTQISTYAACFKWPGFWRPGPGECIRLHIHQLCYRPTGMRCVRYDDIMDGWCLREYAKIWYAICLNKWDQFKHLDDVDFAKACGYTKH